MQEDGEEPTRNEAPKAEVELFYRGGGFEGRCAVIAGEFVVRQGSRARLAEAESLVDYGRAMRKMLLDAGVLRPEGDAYVFTQDYAFPSPSSAAQIAGGTMINGRTAWKLADGRTYKEWQEAQVEAQAASE